MYVKMDSPIVARQTSVRPGSIVTLRISPAFLVAMGALSLELVCFSSVASILWDGNRLAYKWFESNIFFCDRIQYWVIIFFLLCNFI